MANEPITDDDLAARDIGRTRPNVTGPIMELQYKTPWYEWVATGLFWIVCSPFILLWGILTWPMLGGLLLLLAHKARANKKDHIQKLNAEKK